MWGLGCMGFRFKSDSSINLCEGDERIPVPVVAAPGEGRNGQLGMARFEQAGSPECSVSIRRPGSSGGDVQ